MTAEEGRVETGRRETIALTCENEFVKSVLERNIKKVKA